MSSQKLPLVSIIIITRNREQEVLACLKSVFTMNYPNFEAILVDNGSSDNTVKEVKKEFPKTILVLSKTNLGPNGGKNLGQKKAKGDFVFFLDSDTIADKNLLTELILLAQKDEKIGMVCPKIYYFDEKDIIWYAGGQINLLTSQAKNYGCDEKDLGQFDQIRATHYAPTAYLVSRAAAKKVIGHEELFFMSYGESDYGYRIEKAGFKIVFCPTAKLWHRLNFKENTQSIRALGYNLPLRPYYFARNRVIFMKRNASKLNFLIFMFLFFPVMCLYIAGKIVVYRGARKFLRPHLEGCFDGIKYAFGGKIGNRWI